MRVYIVFESSPGECAAVDSVVKLFLDEGNAARFALTNDQYWYDQFEVED
jgi:hypothetical protein